MSKAAYSTLKAAWHIDRIEKMREGEQIVPVEIQLILSDYCNHDCHFCAYRASNGLSSEGFRGLDKQGNPTHNPMRMMPKGKPEEILSHARGLGVKSVIFTGGGEPTAYPGHLQVFEHALALGLDCSLNTNGNVFRDGWKEVLPLFKYVRFSIDAGNDEEYSEIRRVKPGTYQKVLRNLTELCEVVATSGSECVVGTGYVVTPDNYPNLMEGVMRIKATGAKYVRLAAMQSTDGVSAFGEHHQGALETCRDVAKFFNDKNDGFTVVNLFEEVLGTRPDYEFCGFQQFVVYIGGNLKVYRCCYTAYTGLGEIGDLSDKTFLDWFNSKEKKQLIEQFDARSCATCPLNGKNRTINYMIDPDPLHVNFV